LKSLEKITKQEMIKLRKNPKTIKLAEIRRLIREAIRRYNTDNGMPHFYTSDDYKKAKRVKDGTGGSDFYYVKSDLAIREIAEKIFEKCCE